MPGTRAIVVSELPPPIAFWALGRPRTKGSTKFVRSAATGDPVPKTDHRKVAWQGVVACAAGEAGLAQFPGPVQVSLHFFFSRPKGHYGTGRNAGKLKGYAPGQPTSKSVGDIDKLTRAVLDGLTGIAYADDSQVTDLKARKRYTLPGRPEGVRISIRARAE